MSTIYKVVTAVDNILTAKLIKSDYGKVFWMCENGWMSFNAAKPFAYQYMDGGWCTDASDITSSVNDDLLILSE